MATTHFTCRYILLTCWLIFGVGIGFSETVPLWSIESVGSFRYEQFLDVLGRKTPTAPNIWHIESKIKCNDSGEAEILPLYLYTESKKANGVVLENCQIICPNAFSNSFSKVGCNLTLAPTGLSGSVKGTTFSPIRQLSLPPDLKNGQSIGGMIGEREFPASITVNDKPTEWKKAKISADSIMSVNWEFHDIWALSDEDRANAGFSILHFGPLIRSTSSKTNNFYIAVVAFDYIAGSEGGKMRQSATKFFQVTPKVGSDLKKEFPSHPSIEKFGDAIADLTIGALPATEKQSIKVPIEIQAQKTLGFSDKKTGEAKSQLKTREPDIFGLLSNRQIELQAHGNGMDGVTIRVRRLSSEPLRLRIPVGSYFVSSNPSAQNMIATCDTAINLTSEDWEVISVSAACANRSKAAPDSKDSFTIERSPQQAELARLMPVLGESSADYATKQAAVWIVTDDASYDDLGSLVSRPAYSVLGGTRSIGSFEAASAMRVCVAAGINITRKRIWSSRKSLFHGDDSHPELKDWLNSTTVILTSLRNAEGEVRTIYAPSVREGNDDLLKALNLDDLSLLQSALSRGANPNSQARNHTPILIIGVLNNRLAICKTLLEKGAQIEATATNGCTTLMVAAAEGNVEMLKLLLGKGAKIENKSESGRTALIFAAENGRLDSVKLLLAKGAAVESKTINGYTSLILAAQNGRLDVLRFLLDQNADVRARAENGVTPLISAVANRLPEATRLLLEHGPELNAKVDTGQTALMLAVLNNDIDVVRQLLDAGADVRIKDAHGATALDLAKKAKNTDIVKLIKTMHR